jgi:hypothetical protein
MATELDGIGFSNLGPPPVTTPAFRLKGGIYALSATMTGTGTAQLQRLLLDGVTWVGVHAAFTTGANFLTSLYLPAGSYRIVDTVVTALYFEVSGIFGSP